MNKRSKKRNKKQASELKCVYETDGEDNHPPFDEEDAPEIGLEMDTEDAIVQAVDGVLVDGNDEEVRILFYYQKIGGFDFEDDMIRCKAVAEFRTSRKAFNTMVKNFNKRAKVLKRQRKVTDRSLSQSTAAMFA